MAKEGKKDRNDKENDDGRIAAKRPDFGHEIWGIVYLAIAVLVLVSLVSHLVHPRSNVLGQYLGTDLANGLLFLFGAVPSFFFPLAIGALGWVRLRGGQASVRNLFLQAVLTIEICVLLAVHTLPLIAANRLHETGSNWIGVTFMRITCPFFGGAVFGPYFIATLALVLTILVALRISPIAALRAIVAALRRLWALTAQLPARFSPTQKITTIPETGAPEKTAAAASPAAGTPAPQPQPRQRQRKPQAEAGEPAAAPAASAAADAALDPVEAAQRKQFEAELAAFRAKKAEPIKIMTIETAEVETEEPAIDAGAAKDAAAEGAAEELDESDNTPRARRRRGMPAGVPAENPPAAPAEPPPEAPLKPYEIPSAAILTDPPPLSSMIDKDAIERNSAVLEKTLSNFGVEGKVMSVSPGPVVTRYEIVLAPGVKINRIVSLHNDISMAVGGQPIRIEAPIPGKSAVGIELPNAERQIVYFKHVLMSEVFTRSKAKLPVVIGTNISGAPYVADISKMPHMLIAGQTGSGKSVCINSMICSLLMTKKPEELRLILIDPKKVELSFFNHIAHLMSPVVTETKEAVKALHWGAAEMDRRYSLLAKVGARNIDSFNTMVENGKLKGNITDEENKPLPFIVIIVDELADLMSKASRDVETLVQRIAQLARAVGIHLIVATQRPSVDIITGPIKANLTSRIAFRTIQSNDSRTILDHIGAEKLLGLGDMLFLRNGAPQIERFHGAFISEEDVDRISTAVRSQQVRIDKIESFSAVVGGDDETEEAGAPDGSRDEMFEEAAHIIVDTGLGSTSLLQRRLNLGYARAGRIMDQLHDAGLVGPPNGSKAREVLVQPEDLEDTLAMLRNKA